MLYFLQPSPEPVVAGLEDHEVVYAKDQPQYNPLRVIRSNTSDCQLLTRWTLTPEQRKDILDGADIYLELMTFGHPLQPIRIGVGKDVDADYVREQYALTDQ